MILDDILNNLKYLNENNCYILNDEIYTYSYMYRGVCNLYKFLTLNLKDKSPVIVYGHKDVGMPISFLACSFAGITYVPVDTSLPENRLISIIEQIKPSLIIGDYKYKSIPNLDTISLSKIIEQEEFEDINNTYLKEDDIYYIIFTSGSTGIPKGVKVTYKNLNSCIKWLKSVTNAQKEIILNQGAFSFDLSVADLYLSLVTGSCHYVLSKNVQQDLPKLFKNLKNSNATLAVMTPSFADLLLIDKSFNEKFMPDLRKILFCGEVLLPTTVEKIFDRFKNIDIINSYGPTECTFAVTSIHIQRNAFNEYTNISIGKPKDDVKIYIVNDKLEILKDGQVGEILVQGESVAAGYVNKHFNSYKFIMFNDKKAYLTGDLGYIENGNIYYKCRKDRQVKFMGYRIELSDIEENLYKLGYIEKAIVLPNILSDNKVSRLYAFIILKPNISKTVFDIKKDLKKYIPQYMCPNIKLVDEIPLNHNGKCDCKKLMEGYNGK